MKPAPRSRPARDEGRGPRRGSDARPARPARDAAPRGERFGGPRRDSDARPARPARDAAPRGERFGGPRRDSDARPARPARDAAPRGERFGGPRRDSDGRSGRPAREGFARGERSGPRRPQPPATQRRAPRPSNPDVLLARQPWAMLRALVPGGGPEAEAKLEALRGYTKQLLEWNRGVSNLISRNDEPRIVDRHIRESLLPAQVLLDSGCRSFLDFGSGAGLPAVPLALCGVGEHWTLVESRRNKTLFIRKIQQDNGLKHFDVRTARLETVIEEADGSLQVDGFTSRATATVGPTLELAAQVVKRGGKAFLWKGSSYEQEMASARSAWEADWRFERAIPLGEGPNVVAIFERL